MKDKYILANVILMGFLSIPILSFDLVPNDSASKSILVCLTCYGIYIWLIAGGFIIVRLVLLYQFWIILPKVIIIFLVVLGVYFSLIYKFENMAIKNQETIDTIYSSTEALKKSKIKETSRVSVNTIVDNKRLAKYIYTSTGVMVQFRDGKDLYQFFPSITEIEKFKKSKATREFLFKAPILIFKNKRDNYNELLDYLYNLLILWIMIVVFIVFAILMIPKLKK